MIALQSSTPSSPPRLHEAAPQRRAWWWMAGIPVLAAGLALYFFNPTQHGFYPRCFLHEATGILCPGCGGLRATHQLLHGHVLEALRLNALFVVSLPVATVWAWKAFLRRNPASGAKPIRWLWLALVVATIFTVLRNLPVFAWLAP